MPKKLIAKEKKVLLRMLEHGEITACIHNDPIFQVAVGLVRKGLLRRKPARVSPFHDDFKSTREGRQVAMHLM